MNVFWPWLIFGVFVLVLLALDLGVFNRRPHAIGFREAAAWSAAWIVLSLVFNLGVYWRFGSEAALQFFTGYLLEKSLSADNLFLFAVIFTSMGVAAAYQHRVLFWGVCGALVLRGAFIAAGVEMVQHFHWILYVFAIFLLVMGVRLFRDRGRRYEPAESAVIRLARRIFPVTDHYVGGRFFVRARDGRLYATPLLLVLVMIELADVTFAIDSIPAIFAVTQDAFIIFTSNVLAILGLRALYFLLAGAITRFRYLRPALAAILILIGARMLTTHWIHIPTGFALLAVLLALGIGIVASVLAGPGKSA